MAELDDPRAGARTRAAGGDGHVADAAPRADGRGDGAHDAPDARDALDARDAAPADRDVPHAASSTAAGPDDEPPPDSLYENPRRRDGDNPLGTPGRPLSRASPFYVGFFGALGVIAAWYLAQTVFAARQVIVLIVVAAFLAVGLNPVVEALLARGMRRTHAVGLVFVGVIAGFVAFVVAVVPPIVEETTTFVGNAPELLDRLEQNDTIARLERDYGLITRAQDYLTSGDLQTRVVGGLVGAGKYVLGVVFSALAVLVLTLYFLASLPSIKRQMLRLVPASRRERVALLGDEVLARVGGYVSGQILVAFLAAVSALVVLTILELPYALTLAILVGVFGLVPLVGATISAVVVTLVALTDSTTKALICAAFFVLYQQLENYVIYPRVMRRAVDVPPAVTVMAALVGGALLGVIGALIAIPAAAAGLLVVREVLVPRQERV